MKRCRADTAYFLQTYCHIENATDRAWIPFDLWPAQRQVLTDFHRYRLIEILKARQLGLTWLTLGFVLHQMLFAPITIALFFSRGETEAKDLLIRLKGMYARLPDWMKDGAATIDNSQEWRLPSGSRAQSFPTTGGRSYTASIVVVDEADFVEDLNAVMNAVKPTIDAGGKMFLISTVDKGKPESPFKQMYRAAKRGLSHWRPIFLPWRARPGRDEQWYTAQQADIQARTGALDDLEQEYPATVEEALRPRSLDKRIPAIWLDNCYVEMTPILDPTAPALPNLEIYQQPIPRRRYAIGVDPAEGNPTSDDSAITVLDLLSGEEVASLSGKFEPDVTAHYADLVGKYYNRAALMVERNNHGHAVLQWLEEHSLLRRLPGHDEKPGWLSTKLGKALMYTQIAETFRNGNTTLHSFATYMQLASIEGATLLAPKGQHDDRADSYALADLGRVAMAVPAAGLVQGKAKGWNP